MGSIRLMSTHLYKMKAQSTDMDFAPILVRNGYLEKILVLFGFEADDDLSIGFEHRTLDDRRVF